MRLRFLALASAVLAACHIFGPPPCGPANTAVSCERAQELVVTGEVDHTFAYRCRKGVVLRDGGELESPFDCDMLARCDGGCPDVWTAF